MGFAVEGQIDKLETLAQQISIQDIINSLQALKDGLKVLKKYGISDQETGDLFSEDESGYFRDNKQEWRFFEAYPDSSTTSPMGLQKGRANLLLALPREKFERISIDETEKRWMEKQLVQKISECKSITAIKNLFIRYEHVLIHRRIGFFKTNNYSNLAKKFIATAQEKSISLYDKEKPLRGDFLILEVYIFSKKHVQKNFETDLHRNFWAPLLKSERVKSEVELQFISEQKTSIASSSI